MRKTIVMTIALLCASPFGGWGAGALAQEPTTVSSEEQLTTAIGRGDANIRLSGNIYLSKYLDIDGKTVTIDLNGHKLSRNVTEHNSAGHVIWAHGGSNLTLKSTTEGKGIIEGGMANNGGAIHIPHGNTVTATNITFQNNSAADHAGAIWNNGEFTATNCSFTNNTANDVGAIYNSVQTEGTDTYAGTATLTNCTFTGNVGSTGAGALANAVGATVMTIENCTIQNNTAGSRGGGIWNGGTLNMNGKVIVTGNKKVGDIPSNVFLKSGKVITMNAANFNTESRIGVELEDILGTFTSGWGGLIPETVFTADLGNAVSLSLDAEEACFVAEGSSVLYYIERSWDATNKQVLSTLEGLSDGEYTEVTNNPNSSWIWMGDPSINTPEYYVVRGNVELQTAVVYGKNVHLILCDGATLRLTGGLKLEDDKKLHIHCQSYGGNMGKLIVTNSYDKAAGIGSAQTETGAEKSVGELFIHGGHIEATGGEKAAGIGSCARAEGCQDNLCKKVTVYGGFVRATGGKYGAGIGGGAGYNDHGINGGDLDLFDGTVIAQGGNSAAGVGGGGGWSDEWIDNNSIGGEGGTVNIWGGTITATGGERGAGIGSANDEYLSRATHLPRGTVRIYGGTVTANGGKYAAGIGGGYGYAGADVMILNGTVTANGGEHGAGIGGGEEGFVGFFKVYNGTVTANGGKGAAGIGGGYKGDGIRALFDYEYVVFAGGTIIAKAGEQGGVQNRAIGPGQGSEYYGTMGMGDNMMVGAGNNGTVERYFPAGERKQACFYRSYAEIKPCPHSGCVYTVSDTQHTRYCNYCAATKAQNHTFVNGTCTVCHFNTYNSYTVTVYLPDLENGGYKSSTYKMLSGIISMPGCDVIPPGYEFAGWLVNASDTPLTYMTDSMENLVEELSEYNIKADVTFTARYREVNLTLYNNQFNGETLYTYDGRTVANVTLFDRWLYKDGSWNTLCLPFSLTETQLAASPLAGGDFRTLSSATFSNGTLTLNFTAEGEVKSLTAGTPYIVKWGDGGLIQDPRFEKMAISYTYNPVETDVVTFSGNFSPVGCSAGDNTMLYLGADNKLYYPSEAMTDAMTINAFRAYFQLNNGITAGEPSSPNAIRAFVLNFGEGEQTGIAHTDFTDYTDKADAWYSLDGRKLNGKPTQKGIYVVNGKKVVVK